MELCFEPGRAYTIKLITNYRLNNLNITCQSQLNPEPKSDEVVFQTNCPEDDEAVLQAKRLREAALRTQCLKNLQSFLKARGGWIKSCDVLSQFYAIDSRYRNQL